jgi:bacteriocin-like protein
MAGGILGYSFDRQHIRWLEGANMTKDSKDTKPNAIVENKKIELTEEELKKVSGGALSDPEEGGQVRARPK